MIAEKDKNGFSYLHSKKLNKNKDVDTYIFGINMFLEDI